MKKSITLLILLLYFAASGQENERKSSLTPISKSITDIVLDGCYTQAEINDQFDPWKQSILDFIYGFEGTAGCDETLSFTINNNGSQFSTTICPSLFDALTEMFPEQANAMENPDTEHLFVVNGFDPKKLNFILEEESEVYITYVHEGAGWHNTLGYYTYHKDSPPASIEDLEKHVVFPHVKRIGAGGPLRRGDTHQIGTGTFPAGTVIGFYLVAQGFDPSTGQMVDGVYTHYTNMEFNPNNTQQHTLFEEEGCEDLVLTFEDIRLPGGDKDFNDLIFIIRTDLDDLLTNLSAPYRCGGAVIVEWELISSCPENNAEGSFSFIVESTEEDDVIFDLPDNVAEFFSSQAEIDAAFAEWFNSGQVSGGCPTATTYTVLEDPEAPYFCGGSVTVEWVYRHFCATFSQERTFEALVNTPEVTLEPFADVCETTVFTLTGGTPAGGSYYINGTLAADDTFDATLVGTGIHEIIYIVDENGCPGQANQTIEVLKNPCFEVISKDPACHNGEGEIRVIIDEECGTVTAVKLVTLDDNKNEYADASKASYKGTVTDITYIVTTGKYRIEITGINGCVVTEDVTIGNPDPVSVEITAENEGVINCTFEEIKLTASGSTPGTDYTWTGPNGFEASGNEIFVSEAGLYEVVFKDENGCIASNDYTVTIDKTKPTLSLFVSGDLTCEVDEVTLTADSNGEVEWFFNDTSIGTGLTIDVTEPGIYTAIATAANTCFEEKTIEVILDDTPPTLVLEKDGDLNCTNLSVELSATSNGEVEWFFNDTSIGTGLTIDVTEAGIYTAIATAANTCFEEKTIEVILDDTPPTLVLEKDGDLNCTNLSVELSATSNGEVEWFFDDTSIGTGLTIEVTQAGIYTAIATAANTCSEEKTIEVILDNTPPTLTLEKDGDLNCTNLTVELTAISNGEVEWFFNDISIGTGLTASVTQPGTYTAIATADNTCFVEETITVLVDETLPTLSLEKDGDLNCTNLTVELTAISNGEVEWFLGENSVGTGLTINVTQAGTYTAVATADNTCFVTETIDVELDDTPPTLSLEKDGDITCVNLTVELTATSNAEVEWFFNDTSIGSELTIEVAEAGIYTAVATAENTCFVEKTIEVELFNTPPTVTLNPFTPVCASAPAFELTGGSPAGGTYYIDGEEATHFDTKIHGPGTFTITYTYTDENGCSDTAEQVLIVYPEPTVEITAENHGQINCTMPQIELTATGSPDAEGTYIWSGPDGFNETGSTVTVGVAGLYTVEFRDVNGCTASSEYTVVPDFEKPEVTISGDNLLTCVITEITLTAHVEDGISVTWNDADATEGTTLVVTEPGTYIATATAPNGCTETASHIVNQDITPPAIDFEGFIVCHDADPFILDNATPAGGTYTGTGVVDGAFDASVAGVGEHTITYTYTNPETGCTNSKEAVFTVSSPMVITEEVTDLEVWGTGTGAISITVTGGTPPYNYMWDHNNETSPDIENLQAGTYFVTVIDDTGCVASKEIEVGHNSILVDLGVTIEVNIQTPDPDEVDELIFALVITNHDEVETATNVSVENLIPDPFPFKSLINNTGISFNPATGLWVVGDLAPGEWKLLVYTTEMLLTEPDEDEEKSGPWQQGTNTAEILPFDQIDPNLDNNFASITVTTGESTGGDDNGIESNGSMAAQLALRNHRRLVESNYIPRTERTKRMDAYRHTDMLMGSLKTSTADGQHATGIGMLLPEEGPANTQAFISTPYDLLGITNAREIFSVDYLQANNARRAAILAISTEPSSVYEHTKVICDRLVGARLESIEMIRIADRPFILSKLVHPGGFIDYSVSFIAQREGGKFIIDNRWYNEEYEILNTEDIFNFQVWSVTPEFTRELVEEILDMMDQLGGVSFRNDQITPDIPQVFIHSGRYTNGGLLLNIVNKVGADQITIHGNKTLYENAQRQPINLSINIPTDEFVEVFIPTGFIFDIGFSVRNNKDNAPDVLYYADGAWMFDYDPGNAMITNFATRPETNHVEQIEYNVERDASFSGRVRTWASLFRTLSPRNMPVDMTGFDEVVFTAHGEGTIEVMLAKSGINQWSDQFRTTISLTDKPREYRINFSELVTREGIPGFTAEDVVSVIFNPLGNGNTASNFDVNISNLHFANSNYVVRPNAIFYPAYPNPFNRSTSLDLIITNDSHVKIEVLNMFGQVVDVIANREMTTGTYNINWEPAGLRPGVYMIRINAGTDTYTTKVIYQR